MKISNSVKRAVDKGFSTLSSILQTATYTRVSSDSYDPTTGSNTQITDKLIIKGVFSSEEEDNNSDALGETKISFLVKASYFKYELSVNDVIVINALQYNIKTWSIDPSGTLYDIMLTRG